MAGLLRVCLALLLVFLPVMSRGHFPNLKEQQKAYPRERDTMTFAVKLIGGDSVADYVARMHNFENKGKVGKRIVLVSSTLSYSPASVQIGNLENFYVFKFAGDESKVNDRSRELELDANVRKCM